MSSYISVFGDSISTYYGYNPVGYLVYYDFYNAAKNGINSKNDTWWHQAITRINGKLLVNASYSGSYVSGTIFPSANTFERIRALETDYVEPNFILVHLGVNDFWGGIDIGNEKDELSFFYPAYNIMLNRIKECYPKSEVFCSTIMKTYVLDHPEWHFPENNPRGINLENYNNAIRETCNKAHGIYLADLYSTGIAYDTFDGTHPTKRGHSEIAEAFIKALS